MTLKQCLAAVPLRQSFVVDGSGNKTIFTGGGSKDSIDISSWKWKDDAGGLPDKNNITNAAGTPHARWNCRLNTDNREVSVLVDGPTHGQGLVAAVDLFKGSNEGVDDGRVTVATKAAKKFDALRQLHDGHSFAHRGARSIPVIALQPSLTPGSDPREPGFGEPRP
jgi:hypothetical protein